ncbi:MAG: hypothetical protein U0165_16770 [Polyangiaceae bacterium]
MTSTDVWQKLPLGGVDRRQLSQRMPVDGPRIAVEDLARDLERTQASGLPFAKDQAVLLLGGSGGILRSLAIHLLFGEGLPVYAVHYDSEKLQVGAHHARAITQEAERRGVACQFFNADATKPETARTVIDAIKGKHRVVHLINGIAAGATKRFEEHGPTQVQDIDVEFDLIRQIADFTRWSALRKVGKVEVEVATQADIDRTYKFMGHSTTPWAEALAGEGLLVRGESVVAFADYDYEPDDPVYAMGPLAQAKVLQRQAMDRIRDQYGVRTVRLCYPAMNTTALGAIPGGLLMYAGTTQLLVEQGTYASVHELARQTLPVLAGTDQSSEPRYDAHFQRILPEFHRLKSTLTPENVRERLSRVFENPSL